MRRPLEIPIPTEQGMEALEKLYRSTRDVRLRTRAQIVLLAGEQRCGVRKGSPVMIPTPGQPDK